MFSSYLQLSFSSSFAHDNEEFVSETSFPSKLPLKATTDFGLVLRRLLFSGGDILLRGNLQPFSSLEKSLFKITSLLISLLSQRELYLAWKNHIGELNNYKNPAMKHICLDMCCCDSNTHCF
jgi:hypothetical protein